MHHHSFGCATFISTAATINTSFVPSEKTTIGIYAAVLVSQGTHWLFFFSSTKHELDMCAGLINTFGVHLLKYLNNISIWWHAIGTFAVVISILATAPERQSGSFVFTQFLDGTGDPGWSVRSSKGYVVMIGILMAQYTLTGFDASAHVREPGRDSLLWRLNLGCR